MCFECLKPAAQPPQVPVPSGFVERPKRISRRATYGVHTGVSYDTPDTLSKADGVTALRLQLTRLSDSMARRFAREDQNVLFYRGDSQCAPDSLFIDVLHHKWEGDFETLEEKHGKEKRVAEFDAFGEMLFKIAAEELAKQLPSESDCSAEPSYKHLHDILHLMCGAVGRKADDIRNEDEHL